MNRKLETMMLSAPDLQWYILDDRNFGLLAYGVNDAGSVEKLITKNTFDQSFSIFGPSSPEIGKALSADIPRWLQGELIHQVFTYLSPSQKEMLMTGITDEQWKILEAE
jgi:hypothetical protein